MRYTSSSQRSPAGGGPSSASLTPTVCPIARAGAATANVTNVSDPADSTHWVGPGGATRLVDDNRIQNGSRSAGGTMTNRLRLTMIVAALVAALGLSFAGAGV